MALPSPAARWIYERLSHLFINAEKRRVWRTECVPPRVYARFGNRAQRKRRPAAQALPGNISEVRSALQELSLAGVLVPLPKGSTAGTGGPYVEKPVYGGSQGGRRPVVGATWTLFPSDLLVQEIIEANIGSATVYSSFPVEGNEPRKSGGWKESARKFVLNWFHLGRFRWKEPTAKVLGVKMEGIGRESGRNQPRKLARLEG